MQYKACMPVIAPYHAAEDDTVTYDTGKRIGKLMKVGVSPSFDNPKVYGDDDVAEEMNLFKSASVTLGTNLIPLDCEPLMFGCQYDEKNKTKVDGEEDEGSFVGFGSIYGKRIKGKDVYYMEWLHKVKFVLPSEERTTKGETVSFNTPSITGTAYKDATGKWRTTTEYDSLAAAKEALYAKAKMQMPGATTE